MNRRIVICLMLIFLAITISGVSLGFTGAAVIEWLWHGDPIVEAVHHPSGDKVQFGLREDGVVVWRKITQTTNSPAERPPAWTNIIITNLYLEAPWTNLGQEFVQPPWINLNQHFKAP